MMWNTAKRNLQQLTLTAVIGLGPIAALAGETVEREAETSASPMVSIQMDSGSLTIKTWDQHRVFLQGDIDDRAEELQFERRSDNSVDIQLEDSPGSYQSESSTVLTVFMPRSGSVDLELLNVDLALDNLDGDLDIDTVSGDITVDQVSGYLEIDNVNGKVVATHIAGNVAIETVNGGVTIEQTGGDRLDLDTVGGAIEGTSVATDVSVDSVSGPMTLNLGEVKRFESDTIAGELRATLQLQEHGNLDAASVSGRIRLTLLEPRNFAANVASLTGSIRNRITDAEPTKGEFGLGRNLELVEGDASAEITIATVSGTVDLNRK